MNIIIIIIIIISNNYCWLLLNKPVPYGFLLSRCCNPAYLTNKKNHILLQYISCSP